MQETAKDPEYIRLDPMHEIRFILDLNHSVKVSVTFGTVFCNRWELPKEDVVFKNKSFTLSTYENGCSIKVIGDYKYVYKAPIVDNIPSFQILGPKPVVAICGPPSTGKTTIAKFLINTAMALVGQNSSEDGEKSIIYCNMDPAQAPFTPHGSIGALPLSHSIDNKGFPIVNPLVYFFGHVEINDDNTERYSDLVKELATHVRRRRDALLATELGVVLDLPPPTDNAALLGISTIIREFGVTHFISVGDDRLDYMFKTSFPELTVYGLPALGAAHGEEKSNKLINVNFDTKRYFEGDDTSDLISMTYKFSRKEDFKLFAINKREGILVEPTEQLLNSLVAIVQKPELESDLWKQNVIGFLVIKVIKPKEEEIEVLKPKQDFPSECMFISGSVKYADRL